MLKSSVFWFFIDYRSIPETGFSLEKGLIPATFRNVPELELQSLEISPLIQLDRKKAPFIVLSCCNLQSRLHLGQTDAACSLVKNHFKSPFLRSYGRKLSERLDRRLVQTVWICADVLLNV